MNAYPEIFVSYLFLTHILNVKFHVHMQISMARNSDVTKEGSASIIVGYVANTLLPQIKRKRHCMNVTYVLTLEC